MSPSTPKNRLLVGAVTVAAGTVLALAPALSASAHVSASATSTAAGSSTVVTFSVPHGCEGSPTVGITIQLPQSIPTVTPTVNPNWTVVKNVESLAEPLVDAHGSEITERVASVVYTAVGSGLADGYRDTFELSLRLPDGEAGDIVEFPVFQQCAEGSTEWVGDEVPSITLTAAVEGEDHGGGDAGHAETAESAGTAATADASPDVLARVFGIAGLAIGAVGIVIAVLGRRTGKA